MSSLLEKVAGEALRCSRSTAVAAFVAPITPLGVVPLPPLIPDLTPRIAAAWPALAGLALVGAVLVALLAATCTRGGLGRRPPRRRPQ